MPYTLSLDKFYKIWFSKNPHEFLGNENQLRLLNFRYKHPQAELSLIYTSGCLSEKAKEALHLFCLKHRITPIDFDSSFKEGIQTHQEGMLYVLAQQEIAKRETGGNLAAASDIVRLLTPAISLGVYSDFDVNLDCRNLPKEVNIDAPLLFVVNKIQVNQHLVRWQFNNEIIGVAKNQDNEMHPRAHKYLEILRQEILNNYIDLGATIEKIVKKLNRAPYPNIILQSYNSDFEMDIFKFRHDINALNISKYFLSLPPKESKALLKKTYSCDMPDPMLYEALGAFIKSCRPESPLNHFELATELLTIIKHRIYVQCVLQVTGPSIFNAFLDPFYRITEKSIKSCNVLSSPLKDCMVSQSNLPIKQNRSITECLENIGGSCDLSWTQEGDKKQIKRDTHIHHCANTIKYAWIRYRKKQAQKIIVPHVKKAKFK